MIAIIIKTYLVLLVTIGFLSVLIFIGGLFLIFKRQRNSCAHIDQVKTGLLSSTEHPKLKPAITITSKDINAIAGDDIMATQLDLARAYIETGRTKLAKKILEHVMKRGNLTQQSEAKHLLDTV